MYAEFYKLAEEPFPVTPDPKYLYLSDSHKEALASIVYGIEKRRGFVGIVGEVGTGKTTILHAYLNTVDRNAFSIIYIYDPQVTFEELITVIARELGIVGVAGASRSAIVTQIHYALVKEYQKDRTVVLVIDEAQNMPVETLESLRLLSNIETKTTKLLQIVIAGQPELEQLLERRELRQLNQRIAVKSTILPLTIDESRQYIRQRMDAVALEKRRVFDNAALRHITRFAQGIPRLINIACDAALMNGYGHGAKRITAGIASDAIKSLEQRAVSRRRFPYARIAAAVALIAVAAIWIAVVATTVHTVGPAAAVETAATPSSVASQVAGGQWPGETHMQLTRELTETGHLGVQPGENTAGLDLAPAAPDDRGNNPGTAQLTETATEGPAAATNIVIQPVAAVAPETALANPPLSLADRLERIQWDPRPLPDSDFPIVRTVKRGEMISQICFDNYGFLADELYDHVRNYNPQLVDINDVSPGQTIALPALPGELQRARSAYIKRKLRRQTRLAAAGEQELE